MTKHEKGKALVTELESIIQQYESLPALKDGLLKEKEVAEETMRQVIAAYGAAADRVSLFLEKTTAATKTAAKYLEEYHAKDTLHKTSEETPHVRARVTCM